MGRLCTWSRAALAPRSTPRSVELLAPAHVGNAGWATDQGLGEAGFLETDFGDTHGGLRFSYVAPNGASTLEVTYSHDGSRVADVRWSPQVPPPIGPQLDRAPHSFGFLSCFFLGGFFVMAAEFHLAEDPLALHLLLERLEGLIDVIVSDENLHACSCCSNS